MSTHVALMLYRGCESHTREPAVLLTLTLAAAWLQDRPYTPLALLMLYGSPDPSVYGPVMLQLHTSFRQVCAHALPLLARNQALRDFAIPTCPPCRRLHRLRVSFAHAASASAKGSTSAPRAASARRGGDDGASSRPSVTGPVRSPHWAKYLQVLRAFPRLFRIFPGCLQ